MSGKIVNGCFDGDNIFEIQEEDIRYNQRYKSLLILGDFKERRRKLSCTTILL